MENIKYKLIISSSEKSSDIYYASGLSIPDDFIFLENLQTGKRMIFVSPLEYNRAKNHAKDALDVYCSSEFLKGKKGGNINLLRALIEHFNFESVIVPFDFPSGYLQLLSSKRIQVVCENGSFFPERLTKDVFEIEQIAIAQQLNEATIQYGCGILSDSIVNDGERLFFDGELLTSERFKNLLNSYMIERGGYCDTLIASCGKDSSEPHNTGSGALLANQPIVIDNFPRLTDSRYWGDMTRTVVMGKASDIVKNAFNAVFEAKMRALEMVKVGVAVKELHQKTIDILEKAGFKTYIDVNGHHVGFIHGLGHGVGLDIHEPPRVSVNIDHKLVENSVITIEPGVYYPEWGGVRLEDLVVVKNDGCELLNDPKCVLEI